MWIKKPTEVVTAT